jgi:carboxypeptidase family protein
VISRIFPIGVIAIALTTGCFGGSIGPTQATLPLESIEIAGVPSSGTVGDSFPLKATATYVHGQTEDVTSKVTWASSNEATAAVRGAELTLVGAGACEIRASLEQVSVSTPVSVEPRPPGRSTLSGMVSDSVSKRALASAMVRVVNGPDAGRETTTDENGFYSLAALLQGSFTVRVTRGGYEMAEAVTTLSGDLHLDLSLRPLPPPPFTGGTYNVRVSVAPNRCGIDLPSSGRLVLGGSARRLTIRLIQGFDERAYSGSLEDDGTFTGSTGLIGARVDDNDTQAHGISTIKGLLLDANVSGTEKIASHLCPGGLGTVTATFSSR